MNRIAVLILVCLTFICSPEAQMINIGSRLSPDALPAPLRKQWMNRKPGIVYAFSSSCPLSFTSLPRLQLLKQMYGDRVQFFLIAKPDSLIGETYQRFSKFYHFDFQMAIDGAFIKLLATPTLPAVLWIGGDGTIQSTTGPDALTEENIGGLLAATPIYKKRYADHVSSSGISKGYTQDSNFLVRSELAAWQKDEAVTGLLPIEDGRYFQVTGVPLKHLYYIAFTGRAFWPIQDSLYPRFTRSFVVDSIPGQSAGVDWNKLYNYRIAFHDRQDPLLFLQTLQEDLNRAMAYTAGVERRVMPYWRLVALNGDTMRVATRDTHAATHGKVTQASLHYINHPLWPLVANLQALYSDGPPILNETGIRGPIDLHLDAILSDWNSVVAGLRSAGLDLVKGHKMMDVIVLRPKETNVAVRK